MIKQALKRLSIALILSSLSLALNAQALRLGGQLIDLISSESQMIRLFTHNGLSQDQAVNTTQSLNLAWRSLTQEDGIPSASQIRSVINSLDVENPSEMQMQLRLTRLLEKEASEMTQEDLVELTNTLIYFASRRSSDTVRIACSSCAASSVSEHGINFSLQHVQNSTIQRILQDVIPSNPQSHRAFIRNQLNQLGIRMDMRNLPVEKEQSMALFLALKSDGNPSHQNFFDAVISFSTSSNGQVDFFNPRNRHIFWDILSEDMNFILRGDEELTNRWTTMLREVASEASEEANKEQAFYRYLNRKAVESENEDLIAQANQIQTRRCYFR